MKEDFHLSIDEIKNKIDNIDLNKYKIIKITGGEPTIHPDFLEVVDYASRKGFGVNINTNGVKFADNDFLEQTIVNGAETISVSVLSNDLDVFKKAAGSSSVHLSWEGWNNLIKTELTLLPQLVLTKDLSTTLLSTVDKIQETSPGTKVFITGVKPIGRAGVEVFPDYDNIREVLSEVIDKHGEFLTIEDVPLCYFDYTRVIVESYERELTHEKFEKCNKCIVKDRCFGFPVQYKTMYIPTPKPYLENK